MGARRLPARALSIRVLWMNAPLAKLLLCIAIPVAATIGLAATNDSRLLRPLTLVDAIDMALAQNSTIRQSSADLEAAHGVVVQTRAVALPRVVVSSDYSATEESAIDRFRPSSASSTNGALFTDLFDFADQRWSANVRVIQSVYEGGRITSAFRAAKLIRQQALLNHQTIVSDVIRDVRVGYSDVLLAEQQIAVQEASVKLLEKELQDTRSRFDAGTVPKFNVLRAEVELASARPRLIRARNAYRVSKAAMAQILGESISADIEDPPLQLTDKLTAPAFDISLANALRRAFENRPELAVLRASAALRRENVATAKAGFKPSVQLFAGYGGKSSQFSRDLTDELHGWEAGAQLNWNLFDGFLTRGRVQEARALQQRSEEQILDASRRIELDVRTAWSSYVEAREVLDSQLKVQESAEEALRLASARAVVGSATQLDVLDAQTSLTDARTTQAQALRDYAVAAARLERAIGPASPSKPAAE